MKLSNKAKTKKITLGLQLSGPKVGGRKVPPSLEGAELIEQMLLEDNFKEVFSLFTTLHDIHVLYIFYILQVNFVPTCFQVQSFDSQQNAKIDVHESQFVLKTTST